MKKIKEYGGGILLMITILIGLAYYQERIEELRAMEETNIVEVR